MIYINIQTQKKSLLSSTEKLSLELLLVPICQYREIIWHLPLERYGFIVWQAFIRQLSKSGLGNLHLGTQLAKNKENLKLIKRKYKDYYTIGFFSK